MSLHRATDSASSRTLLMHKGDPDDFYLCAHLHSGSYSLNIFILLLPLPRNEMGYLLANSTHCSTPAIQKKHEPQNVEKPLAHLIRLGQQPASADAGMAKMPHSMNPQPPSVLKAPTYHPILL
mmetsp:Transcript_30686/g.45440  ORF Transcript_30686/g.45440 Transcript_30686/m.45440 type:complete len:123 (-) Transcript_30686:1148-1516(-)